MPIENKLTFIYACVIFGIMLIVFTAAFWPFLKLKKKKNEHELF